MQIVITVEDRDPPAGVVSTGSGDGDESESVPFTGWLGLLSVLSEIIEPPELRRGGG